MRTASSPPALAAGAGRSPHPPSRLRPDSPAAAPSQAARLLPAATLQLPPGPPSIATSAPVRGPTSGGPSSAAIAAALQNSSLSGMALPPGVSLNSLATADLAQLEGMLQALTPQASVKAQPPAHQQQRQPQQPQPQRQAAPPAAQVRAPAGGLPPQSANSPVR